LSSFEDLKDIDWKNIDWKDELSNNINSVDKLKYYLEVPKDDEKTLREVVDNHPLNIPRYYLSLIDQNDPNDPIAKMALPDCDELIVAGAMGETTKDPYGDDKHNKGNGILHKYPYSALIVTTDYCSMYCRHCFRKAIVGLPNDKTVDNFQKAVEYIKEHKEITNVILSGGDPFLITTSRLKKMLGWLEDIDHINYVRIGTRTPVVYPMRFFDDELLDYLKEFNKKKALYIPTHFNHVKEITPIAKEAILKLREAGLTVNNQAVFLKGVNDSVEDIRNLMDGLVRIGVNPYYLYQCMPVSRVRHHFQVPLMEGIDIVDEAKEKLDGYAKRFKFIMGHDIGKVEIIGRVEDKLILKQIHSRPEEPKNASRIIVRKMDNQAGWLDDTENIDINSELV
jgi:KamA family protein